MKAIELKNISFTYDGSNKPALSNVDFVAEYGKVTLISGYSGSGKSTILSLICGIIPNVILGNLAGDILVDGVSIIGKKINEICRKVGVVLQNADSQIINKVVEDEVAFGCENFAFAPDKIKSQIDIVCKLLKLEKKWPTNSLSGGQKQRLVTACILAMGQKILILDEPLANLDCSGADFLMHTLKSLAQAGYAVVVVEHRLDVVIPYVDDIWNIVGGNITLVADKQSYLAYQSAIIRDDFNSYKREEIIFELKNIAFSVAQRSILKDVSFVIGKNERCLLLGENGCGKTTLMRIIAQLNKPTSGGVITKLDSKIVRNNKKWFKEVGVVYQNPNYQLFMPTVEKEIKFKAFSSDYAMEIISLFKLEDLLHRHPQSLSEGQKRRVSIAAVVARKPTILFLDEPTVGQDYAALKDLIEILNELHRKTANTMITITHDLRCAEALCDHAVWLENGVVREEGGKELAHKYFFADS